MTKGQIATTHSVSAGLDYPAVGPEHALLKDQGRVEFARASDAEAVAAFHRLSATEGILPALETAHALAHLETLAPRMDKKAVVLVNLSGRGDKDVESVLQWMDEHAEEAAAAVAGNGNGSTHPAARKWAERKAANEAKKASEAGSNAGRKEEN